MKLSKVIVGLGLLVGATSANAGFVNTDWGTITTLNMTGSGDLTLGTTATRINPASCSFSAYKLSSSASFFKNYYALLLTSKALGSEVRFRIDDTNCLDGVNPSLIFIETRDAS